MSITTLDGVIAGMQPPVTISKGFTPTLVTGRPHSLFYLAGMPGAATAPTPGMSGAALTTYAGQLPFANPASGNTYLARFSGMATVGGVLILCDRLWHNSGLNMTLTSAQTISSAAFPARSADGTVNGSQVMVGLEVTAATGAGTPTLTMSYTNDANASGKTGTGLLTGVGTSAIGAFYPMGLAAGDTGVRSIQTFTLSATWSSGSASLVAYRELARLEIPFGNIPNAIDALTSGMPRLFDNTVPFLIFIPSNTTASYISGSVIYTQG